MTEIQNELFALKDGGYKQFNQKLIPTVNPVTVIGVRTPDLRKLARTLSGSTAAAQFYSSNLIIACSHLLFGRNP